MVATTKFSFSLQDDLRKLLLGFSFFISCITAYSKAWLLLAKTLSSTLLLIHLSTSRSTVIDTTLFVNFTASEIDKMP